ncbi:hypothetical protein MLD38_009179 [Melastoma candidum]|uniref:Uncharacterized protein n=1 Tax=Melastoma candidum TaxID=119954 RepID=A0ACB9S0F0_9MYRT|nr:hypothetical protein MLD38_009179 [Melastoma candidum]
MHFLVHSGFFAIVCQCVAPGAVDPTLHPSIAKPCDHLGYWLLNDKPTAFGTAFRVEFWEKTGCDSLWNDLFNDGKASRCEASVKLYTLQFDLITQQDTEESELRAEEKDESNLLSLEVPGISYAKNRHQRSKEDPSGLVNAFSLSGNTCSVTQQRLPASNIFLRAS